MRKIEYIDVTFSDHTIWRLPAYQVAEARARYFAAGDVARGEGDYETVFQDEIKYALTDQPDLLDYLENSMDWADFGDTAILLAAPDYETKYEREFTNAPKEVRWSDGD
jgi:hypothetical protein